MPRRDTGWTAPSPALLQPPGRPSLPPPALGLFGHPPDRALAGADIDEIAKLGATGVAREAETTRLGGPVDILQALHPAPPECGRGGGRWRILRADHDAYPAAGLLRGVAPKVRASAEI